MYVAIYSIMSLGVVLVCIVLSLPLVSHLYRKWKLNHWERKGVSNPGRVVPLRGNPFSEVFGNYYNEFKAKGKKFFGIFTTEPVFVPIDLDFVKSIMQTDYSHFQSHGFYVNEETDPLTGHLFNLEGERWKNLRARLTPTFTSGKMKMMFGTMVHNTTNLVDVLNELVDNRADIDIKEYLARFNTDIIGSVAFGVECNTLKNPDSAIREYSLKVFQRPSFKGILIHLIRDNIPEWLFQISGLKTTPQDVEDFFFNLVRTTVDYREKNNVSRKDFLHLLIQLKNIGRVTDGDEITSENGKSALTFNEMVAQCFVFFTAGFETSSTTMSFALLELAQNQDIQEKLRRDMKRVLEKHENKITYDAVMEMEYLEMVINETLRKHPPVVMLPRKCTRTYRVPNSNVVINSGTQIAIPIYSIHRDPDNYPDPEKFDPERFRPGNSDNRHSYSFIPFGEGPRLCIGSRFGKLQSKVGLISIITNFKVTLNEKTQLPIKYAPTFIIASVKGGVWLNLEKL